MILGFGRGEALTQADYGNQRSNSGPGDVCADGGRGESAVSAADGDGKCHQVKSAKGRGREANDDEDDFHGSAFDFSRCPAPTIVAANG